MFIQNHNPASALEKANSEFVKSILPDYLRQAAGLKHGSARQLAELRHTDLEQLAKEISPSHRSVNSRDFADSMTDSMSALLSDIWPDYSKRLDPFCRVFEVENFKPVSVNEIIFPEMEIQENQDLGFETSVGNPENRGRVYDKVELGFSTPAQLQTFETKFRVSPQLWATHGESLARALQHQSVAFANLELRLLSGVLTQNPNLSDSAALFTAENSTASALDATTMDTALDWLATGSPACLPPSGLLIGPGKEYAARKLLTDAGMNLPIVVSPWLATGSWYLFSNPVQHAAILRLREKGGYQAPRMGWTNLFEGQKGYFAAIDLSLIHI